MVAFFGSGYEWLIVLVVALLLFSHRIPGMAKSLGSGIVEFKKGLKGDSDKKGQEPLPPPASGESVSQNPQHDQQQDSAKPG